MKRETSPEFLRIDISAGKIRKVISACQKESYNRTVHFQIVSNGVPIDLSNLFYAEILEKRADGTETDNPCIIDGDDIQYTLKTTDISVIGENEAHLMLTFKDGQVLETPVFYINVFSTFYNPAALQSQNEYNTLTQMVVDASDYAAAAEASKDAAAEIASEASETADIVSEYASTAASEAGNASDYASQAGSHASTAQSAASTAASETASELDVTFNSLVDEAQSYASTAQSAASTAASETTSELSATFNSLASQAGTYAANASTYASEATSEAGTANSQASLASEYAASASEQASTAASEASQAASLLSSTSEYAASASEQASVASSQASTAASRASETANYLTSTSELTSEAGAYAGSASAAASEAAVSAAAAEEAYEKMGEEQLVLGETSSTAYRGDRGKTAFNHSQSTGNPHNTTAVEVGADPAGSAAAAYQQAAGYTDAAIANLINGAPSTLDTLKEIADAMATQEDVVQALNAAIGTKANETDFEGHRTNDTIHITAAERTLWNGITALAARVTTLEGMIGYPIDPS